MHHFIRIADVTLDCRLLNKETPTDGSSTLPILQELLYAFPYSH
jgi:hypothetical protein